MRFLLLCGVIGSIFVNFISGATGLSICNPSTKVLNGVLRDLAHNVNEFTTDLITADVDLQNNFKDINYVTSPYNIYILLSMLTYGTKENTRKELQDVLKMKFEKCDGSGIVLQRVVKELNNCSNFLVFDQTIFFRNSFQPKEEYRTMIEKIFPSKVVDFSIGKQAKAKKIMNVWASIMKYVSGATIIDSADFVDSTNLILGSVAYLKIRLTSPFTRSTMRFRIQGKKEKEIPSINVRGSFKKGAIPEIGASFVQIPCELGNSTTPISMFLIRPDEPEDFETIRTKIEKITVDRLLNGQTTDLRVILPDFEIENIVNYNKSLVNMHLNKIFTLSNDFDKILDHSKFKVSKVLQKAYIGIDQMPVHPQLSVQSRIKRRDRVHEGFVMSSPFMIIIGTTGENATTLFVASYTGLSAQ